MTRYRKVTVPQSDLNVALLHDSGPLGIIEENGLLSAYFAEDADISSLREREGFESTTIEEADWSEKWKSGITEIRVGCFTIVPPWLDEKGSGHRIIIEPAMGFGTGEHATTRGCLAFIERHARSGCRMLDFGCGSGILSIAAKKLGAASATAVDIDADALANARENFALNGVDVELIHADTPPDGTFDLICANIQSSVIVPMIPSLIDRLAHPGALILSGLLDHEDIGAHAITAKIVEHPWMTLELSR